LSCGSSEILILVNTFTILIPKSTYQFQTKHNKLGISWYHLVLTIYQVLSPIQYQYCHGIRTTWYCLLCLPSIVMVPILVIYRKPLIQIQNWAHHNDLAGKHNLMQYHCVIYCSYSHTNLYYTILLCIVLLCAVRPNAVAPLACLVSVLFRGLTERYNRISLASNVHWSIYQGEGYSAQICNNVKKRENENSF
jgi:hypothetical protein